MFFFYTDYYLGAIAIAGLYIFTRMLLLKATCTQGMATALLVHATYHSYLGTYTPLAYYNNFVVTALCF